jgi:hypothetical protein
MGDGEGLDSEGRWVGGLVSSTRAPAGILMVSVAGVSWVAGAIPVCSGSFVRFFLFFLVSAAAAAAGPLDTLARASVVDLGIAEGSDGISGGLSWGVRREDTRKRPPLQRSETCLQIMFVWNKYKLITRRQRHPSILATAVLPPPLTLKLTKFLTPTSMNRLLRTRKSGSTNRPKR